MTNCCLIDFKGMLENGFKIGNAEVESPKSIRLRQLKFHKSSPMLLLVSTGAVQLTVSMKSWRLMREELSKAPQGCGRVGLA